MRESFPIDGSAPFWKTLSPEDWHELFETGRLEGELLARYWRASEWQAEMPAYIEIMVSRRDLERLVRERKRRVR